MSEVKKRYQGEKVIKRMGKVVTIAVRESFPDDIVTTRDELRDAIEEAYGKRNELAFDHLIQILKAGKA